MIARLLYVFKKTYYNFDYRILYKDTLKEFIKVSLKNISEQELNEITSNVINHYNGCVLKSLSKKNNLVLSMDINLYFKLKNIDVKVKKIHRDIYSILINGYELYEAIYGNVISVQEYRMIKRYLYDKYGKENLISGIEVIIFDDINNCIDFQEYILNNYGIKTKIDTFGYIT